MNAVASDHEVQGTPIRVLEERALRIATEHGFTDASVDEDIMLVVTEIAEAMEDVRAGHPLHALRYRTPSDRPEYRTVAHLSEGFHLGYTIDQLKPIGVPSELADVVIRLLHFGGKHKLDLEKCITAHYIHQGSVTLGQCMTAGDNDAFVFIERGNRAFGAKLMQLVTLAVDIVREFRIDREDGGSPADACAVLLLATAQLAAHHKIDLVGAVESKMRYNALRPYKHGGKTV